jgi:serine/threonine protein kinase
MSILDLPAPRMRAKSEHPSWGFEEGYPIADGRSVLKRLGGGKRYEVYLVWDSTLFALAVAKILRPDQATDEHELDELRREAEVLERLAHPVIVRGFDAVLDGPCPHLLIEYLEGPSLRSLIQRHGALPTEEVLPLALHVAAALHYMSERRMIHLDVKPDNIIMGAPPRLIDLSIAQPFDRVGELSGAVGTDAYMAPEQCPASGGMGPASDVWGLGATLYHALTGRVPFPRDEEWESLDNLDERWPQLSEPPAPLPRSLPADLRNLIDRMLRTDPHERPAASEVAVALEPLVGVLATRRLRFAKRPRGFPIR